MSRSCCNDGLIYTLNRHFWLTVSSYMLMNLSLCHHIQAFQDELFLWGWAELQYMIFLDWVRSFEFRKFLYYFIIVHWTLISKDEGRFDLSRYDSFNLLHQINNGENKVSTFHFVVNTFVGLWLARRIYRVRGIKNFENHLAYVTINWTTTFIPEILFNECGFTESDGEKNPLVNDGAV